MSPVWISKSAHEPNFMTDTNKSDTTLRTMAISASSLSRPINGVSTGAGGDGLPVRSWAVAGWKPLAISPNL